MYKRQEYFYHLLLEFFGRDRVYGLETLGHRKIARIYAASGVQCRAIAMDDLDFFMKK